MEVGDLVQRKGSFWPNLKAIVTEVIDEHHVKIVWLDTGAKDSCGASLLEVLLQPSQWWRPKRLNGDLGTRMHLELRSFGLRAQRWEQSGNVTYGT